MEQYVHMTTPTHDNSLPEKLVPTTVPTQDNSYPGQVVHRNAWQPVGAKSHRHAYIYVKYVEINRTELMADCKYWYTPQHHKCVKSSLPRPACTYTKH